MPRTMTFLVAAAALVAVSAAAAATDWAAMRADDRVQSELLGASMAYLLVEECPSIKLRRLKLVTTALSLSSHAKGLGYSGSEVEAYVNDPDEQARFRARALERLIEKGAMEGDAESFCEVGRGEMEKGSYVGALLKGG